jgi:hypothetical protein
MEEYTYKALDNDPVNPQIRLLRLLPGSHDAPIQCTIGRVGLNEPPHFEALSYTWGTDQSLDPVICDGKTISVTSNLLAALHQFRSRSRARTLWIDAICINQADNAEKAKQVVLMRRIYTSAHRVLIWLGPNSGNSWEAMMLIPKLLRAKEIQAAKNSTRIFMEMGAQEKKDLGLPLDMNSAYPALRALLKRTWFTRMWIIQEVAVSREAILVCGNWDCTWADFTAAIDYACTLLIPPMQSNAVNYLRIFQIEQARCSVAAGKTHNLLALLSLYRSFGVTDQKDKIYALLGLASDIGPEALAIDPNYSLKDTEVYKAVAIEILRKELHLDLLSVPKAAQPSRVGKLPSWVPDWTNFDFACSLRAPNPSTGANLFDFKAAPERKQIQFREDGNILGLTGLTFDYIVKIGRANVSSIDDDTSFFRRVFRVPGDSAVYCEWRSIAASASVAKYPISGEDYADAYWQLLAGGQVFPNIETSKDDYLLWDQICRKPFRFFPTSPWLRWVQPLFVIPSLLLYIIAIIHARRRPGVFENAMRYRPKMVLTVYRRLFKTKKGYLGLGPRSLKKGDEVALLKGGMVPLVIRKTDNNFELVGDCYVHGIMHGEAFSEEACRVIWLE